MSKGASWGRRSLIAFTILLALPLLLFLLSNLLLRSPLGCEFLCKQLEERSKGIRYSLASGSWSPWNGVSLNTLRIDLAQAPSPDTPPLFTAKQLSLTPQWSALLKGKPAFREIFIERPIVTLPLETLFLSPTPTPAPSPKTAAKPTPEKAKKTPSPQAKPKPAPPQSDSPPQPKTQTSPAITPEKAPTSAKTTSPHPQKQRSEEPLIIIIQDAQIKLSHHSQQLLQVDKLSLTAPLAGPATRGSITWQTASLAGVPISRKTTLPVEWNFPNWTLPQTTLAPLGLEANLTAQLGIRKRNRPFQVNLALPSQPIPETKLPLLPKTTTTVSTANGTFKASGFFNRPQTWRADALGNFQNIEIHSGHHRNQTRDITFDAGLIQGQLRNLSFKSPLLALQSEQLSLLGNGWLRTNGQASSVIRIVASPSWADLITNAAVGSRLSPWTSNWLTPLQTPDRYYRDIHISGPLNKLVTDGSHRIKSPQTIPLNTALQRLKSYFLNEDLEELLPIEPTPETVE